MVVQHNMQANNASRMLNITTGAQSKTAEKLSSGYRINRAADDAAGLSISEKMRKQIRGLDQASTNAQDGVSAVQTAEGALTEVHDMLQRMNELAVQASNGTNSETDRQSIQDEIDQLTTEIDRVAETTKFNESYLLKGDTSGNKSTHSVAAHDAGLAGTLTDNGNGTTTFKLSEKLQAGDSVNIAGKSYTIGKGMSTESYASATDGITAKALENGDSVTIDGKEYTLTNKIKAAVVTNGGGNTTTQYSAVAGDQITTSDGTVYEYKACSTNVNAGWYEKDKWEDTASFAATTPSTQLTAIATEGSKLKLNSVQTNSGQQVFEITKKLDDGEVSAYSLGASSKITATNLARAAKSDDNYTLLAGDQITRSGETTTMIDGAYSSTKLSDVQKAIGKLASGTTVTISDIDGKNTAVYFVAENASRESVNENKLTRESLSALLEEGQQVTMGSAATDKYTVAGADADDEDAITVQKAYNLMAKELETASSIGADTAASVTVDGNGGFEIKQGTIDYTDKLTLGLHVGADADMTNKISIDLNVMDSAYLGVKGLNVSDDTGIAATYAIDAIADAVSKVSAQRSALGAVQNRLEHTIANVDNVVENSTAAESRIRDTDMADEMVKYSKNNILAQAGQSMLAQANQSTQGVLSILG